jgi:hypothetical protein
MRLIAAMALLAALSGFCLLDPPVREHVDMKVEVLPLLVPDGPPIPVDRECTSPNLQDLLFSQRTWGARCPIGD